MQYVHRLHSKMLHFLCISSVLRSSCLAAKMVIPASHLRYKVLGQVRDFTLLA